MKQLETSILRAGLLAVVLFCLNVTVALAQEKPAATAAATTGTAASDATQPPAASPTGEFAKDQLEQLVAPIALYPDAVLTQILMASTYPLEIVEADRFMKKNPKLAGDALDKALLEQDWDPSVKSLCSLPNELAKMSENLDWTQDLGDAFLGQQTEVMDTVQRLRGLAYDEGNLKSNEQQTVTEEPEKIIVIQSANPEVIYVPTYNTTAIYGPSWSYPYWYYPPMYYYPPGAGLITFGVGMFVGAAIWGGCNWGWGRGNVNININRYNNFNRNTNINGGRNQISNTGRNGTAGWSHDASHRKGVNYRSQDVAQRNGATSASNRVSKDQARGRTSTSNRATAGTSNRASTGASNRASAGTSQASNRSASSASNRASTANRSASSGTSSASRNSTYSGSRSPSADRMSSSRGAYSRGSTSYGGARGGMRGGGGRRR
jgi:hypothetical protein